MAAAVYLLCYLSTSKLCVFQPMERFLQGSIQRERSERRCQLITGLIWEMGKPGMTQIFRCISPPVPVTHRRSFPGCVKSPHLRPVIFYPVFPWENGISGEMGSVLLDGEKCRFPGGRSRRNMEMPSEPGTHEPWEIQSSWTSGFRRDGINPEAKLGLKAERTPTKFPWMLHYSQVTLPAPPGLPEARNSISASLAGFV